MTQTEYAAMLAEVRFIEKDLTEISDHLKKLDRDIADMKRRTLPEEAESLSRR